MKYIDGDLISIAKAGEFDIIGHGCNCFHSMNSGIAPQIKSNWPQAYSADLKTAYGSRDKLGTYSKSEAVGLTILNIYSQFKYGTHQIQVDYDAMRRAFKAIKREFGGEGRRFGFPKIGAGLAGGNWDIISKIIDEELINENVTIVVYLK